LVEALLHKKQRDLTYIKRQKSLT